MSILSVEVTMKHIFLNLDSIIYSSITWMYSVFMSIAGARIFKSAIVTQFVNRMYLIVSIVMLFIVAYSFLTVIIDPDNFSKGNTSPVKIIRNIVLSLVIITIVPSAFSFGFAFQKAVVDENIIGKLVLGNKVQTDTSDFDQNAADFSVSLFETNFYLKDSALKDTNADVVAMVKGYEQTQKDARANNSVLAFQIYINDKKEHIADINPQPSPQTKAIQYNILLAGVVGIYVLYTLLIFSIDIGLRVVKLFFLQMIAPFPTLLMIVPGKDKIFQNWLKEVLKTYLEVFIKIAIIVFGVFLINVVADQFATGKIVGFESSNKTIINFAKIFIFLGIIMFMKQAPKLVEDIFGFKFSEHGLSLTKRLKDIKEGAQFIASPITKPANRIAGAAIGLSYANRARRIGEKVRGKRQTLGQSFMTTVGGLVNGIRGGVKNAGSAFDYEMTNQQWYSSAEYESMGGIKRSIAGLNNRLRNNVGAPSLYREKEAQIELDYNHELAKIETELSNRKTAADSKINDIEKKYKPVIQRDDDYSNAIKAVEDHCNSKVQKEDSEVVIGGIQTAVKDKSGKWVMQTIQDSSGKDVTGNYASIQAVIDQIKDNEDIDPMLRTQIITANTKLQKSLGGIYKESVEKGYLVDELGHARLDASGARITVKPDVEMDNLKGALQTIITQYGAELGQDENGEFDLATNKGYSVIGASSSLKDLHDKLDEIKKNNAKGKRDRELASSTAQYENASGVKVTESLFEIKQKNEADEQYKKELAEKKAAEQMALSGYKRMDDMGKNPLFGKDKKN